MGVLALVINDASFDQHGFFSVELLIWFAGFDKLCGVCSPGTVSLRDKITWEGSPEERTNRI